MRANARSGVLTVRHRPGPAGHLVVNPQVPARKQGPMTLNTTMLRQVAAAIEQEPDAFEMATWLDSDPRTLCGTVGCIAGTTVMQDPVWVAENIRDRDDGVRLVSAEAWRTVPRHAAKMLGLTVSSSPFNAPAVFISATWWMRACEYLGLPHPDWADSASLTLDFVTAKHAATVLHALADGTISHRQFSTRRPCM